MSKEKYEDINQSNYKMYAHDHAKFNLSSTLFLAYRDTGVLLNKHLSHKIKKKEVRLLDYGCGTGLSTFLYSETLSKIGYNVEICGVDINLENISVAKERIQNGTFIHFKSIEEISFDEPFDLIICNFVLLELPYKNIIAVLSKLHKFISTDGILMVTNASRQSYNPTYKWYTLNNNFPQNKPQDTVKNKIADGQKVTLAVKDPISGSQLFKFYDFFYSSKSYAKAFKTTGFNIIETYKPLGQSDDGIPWLSEREVSPYKIQVLYPESISPHQSLSI